MGSIYSIYAGRLRDPAGKALVEAYLRAEEDRGRRLERYLSGRGASPSSGIVALFSLAGRIYGRITSRLGTRVMLRIVLSACGRASRRACASLGGPGEPERIYLATLRARNEGDLLDALRQHLIDTRPRGR